MHTYMIIDKMLLLKMVTEKTLVPIDTETKSLAGICQEWIQMHNRSNIHRDTLKSNTSLFKGAYWISSNSSFISIAPPLVIAHPTLR